MAWGLGVDGRPAAGLQSPHRAPKALCGSCDAREGERIRSRGLSRPGWREIVGTLGQLQAGRQAGNGMACSRAKARRLDPSVSCHPERGERSRHPKARRRCVSVDRLFASLRVTVGEGRVTAEPGAAVVAAGAKSPQPTFHGTLEAYPSCGARVVNRGGPLRSGWPA